MTGQTPADHASANPTRPVISIVIATYNAAATLKRCLDSITAQTYPHLDIVIMDGGSTDSTLSIVQSYGEKISACQSAPDKGIYDAWNKALAHVRGDWIGFLGADDYLWDSEVLEKLAPHLATQTERVVYGTVAVLNTAGDIVRKDGRPWPECKDGFTQSMTIPHPGALHHKSLFVDHGSFDISYKICGDYEFLMRELKTADARFVPDLITVGMLHGGASNAPKNMETMLQELARIRKNHGIPEPTLWNAPKVLTKMRLAALANRVIGEHAFRQLADTARTLRGKPTVWR